jgi:hypothetical protein
LATKKQKAARRDKKDKETSDIIQQPVEKVRELDDKIKGQDKKRKGK